MSFQRCMIDKGKHFQLLKLNLNSLFWKPRNISLTNNKKFPHCIRCSTFSFERQQCPEFLAERRDFSTASETHRFEDNEVFQNESTSSGTRDKSCTENSVNYYTTRTHTCGELRPTDIGKKVTLCGWAEFIRLNKFILLRDAYGTTQVILQENDEMSAAISSLHLESTICVSGTVRARPESQIKKSLSTGEIEVEAESVRILCNAIPKLPFHIRDYNKASERTSNQHRYLALRFPELQHNLRLRSEMLFKMREFLIRCRNFVEVETPTLFKKTPGGAQEFIVPTSFKDKFYSLVQSPQQLKQLLMVGSIDRYFQIARCYRDEKSSSERQPEFTQLDVELSFTNVEGVLKLTEEILAASWPASKTPLQIPFPRIKYKDALENYGSDKPCLIDQFCIQNLNKYVADGGHSKHVHMFLIPNGKIHHSKLSPRFSELSAASDITVYSIKVPSQEKFLQALTNIVPGFDVTKFRNDVDVKNDDLVIMAVGSNRIKTLRMLGLCRHHTVDHLKLIQKLNENGIYQFFWVVDFPLVALDDDKEIVSVHHPFTQPHPEDVSLTDSDILKVRSLAYDLVLNGSEIGGGSIRIHDAELQKKMFQLLNLDESYFSHLLKALQMGCPPHGGIALGLDRLVAILCNCESIRDVIAFPKSADGFDFMTECPNDIPTEDKIRYHISSNSGKDENLTK